MLKGQEIFQKIAKDMESIFKEVPEFGNASIKILESIAALHQLGIDYKNPNKNDLVNVHLDKITNILIESIKKDYITKNQLNNIYQSIQNMMDADTDYVLDHLNKLSEHFSNINKATQELSNTLDRACGKIPNEESEKPSIMKSIGKILNFRKNNNVDIQEKTNARKNKI
jgi:seryl-tRNA synthetase